MLAFWMTYLIYFNSNDLIQYFFFFFFASRRRRTRSYGDWSSDVCSSDLVNRFQGVLAEFDKVLRALNDKAIDVDRRVTELTGRIEVKVGTLATQQGDQAVKLDALEKTVAAAVATVNENSRGLGELKRVMEDSLGKQAVGGEVPEATGPVGPGSAAKDPSNGASRTAPASTLSDKEAYDRAQQHFGQGNYCVASKSLLVV